MEVTFHRLLGCILPLGVVTTPPCWHRSCLRHSPWKMQKLHPPLRSQSTSLIASKWAWFVFGGLTTSDTVPQDAFPRMPGPPGNKGGLTMPRSRLQHRGELTTDAPWVLLIYRFYLGHVVALPTSRRAQSCKTPHQGRPPWFVSRFPRQRKQCSLVGEHWVIMGNTQLVEATRLERSGGCAPRFTPPHPDHQQSLCTSSCSVQV